MAKWIAARDIASKQGRLYPLDGGQPRALPGLMPGENFDWTSDPKFMYVTQWEKLPVRVYRLNIVTGQRQLFKEMSPMDATGLCDLDHVMFSADGRSYVYGYTRLLSDLYLVKGLK